MALMTANQDTPGRVLVFIPMYNCEKQIPRVLSQLKDGRVAALVDGVICVNNRSTDDTEAVAVREIAMLPIAERLVVRNDDNYGLGGSHKVAIQVAADRGYEYMIVLHGDDQGSIMDIVPHLENGRHAAQDFLMGARFMPGSSLQGYSIIRTFANHIFNAIFSIISRKRLYDLGSGLNLFRVNTFSDRFHFRYADDLTFNYFLILGVVRKKFKLDFFPLTWREDDQVSNARLFRMGRQLVKIIATRVFSPNGFFSKDHREKKHADYTFDVISQFPAPGPAGSSE